MSENIDEESEASHRAYLLEQYGLTPTMCRAWLESLGFNVDEMEEDISWGSHIDSAMLRIARANDGIYLLEDVYFQINKDFEDAQMRERRDNGFSGRAPSWIDAGWITGIRLYTLRAESESIRSRWALEQSDQK